MLRKALLFLTVLFLLCVVVPCSVLAKDLTLAWDANTDPSVVGYRLYYKADSTSAPFNGVGAYEGPSPIDIGNATSATLTGLADGRNHYFTVTAYNASGQESTYSNIVASPAVVSDNPNSVDNTWEPLLWYPANGAIAESIPVQLDWEPLPAGSLATFTLYYGTDPDLDPNNVAANAINPQGTPALLAGVCLIGGVGLAARRRRLLLMMAQLATVILLCSCGGGGGGSSNSTTPENVGAYTSSVRVYENLEDNIFLAEDLQAGTTYYWKVVAVDGQNRLETDTYSFTTKAN